MTFSPMNRRQVLQAGVALSAAFSSKAVFADRIATPTQTEGPFYPDKMPLDTDNDLIVINDKLTPAVGEITHLSGRILDAKGNPLRNAFVEIWQVDNNAVYINSNDKTNRANQDTNFQGYGRFLTDAKGQYYFRTIKPVPYPGRTPHIHFGISKGGERILTTQLYVKDHPGNAKDGPLRGIQNKEARDSVIREFKPLADSKIGELTVDFDIVLGKTAWEDDQGEMHGIGKSEYSQRQRRG